MSVSRWVGTTSLSPQVFAEVAVTSRHSMVETTPETAEVSNTTKDTGGAKDSLLGGLEHVFSAGGDWNMTFIFPYIGNNHPNWLL